MVEKLTPHTTDIAFQERYETYKQFGQVVWFTGLSGAGKTTLAVAAERKLIKSGYVPCLLDGDSIRHGMNSDLGFDEGSRKENIRRLAELSVYLAEQGFIVLVSAISPHLELRQFAKQRAMEKHISFYEVYVKASLETCLKRDPKQLYKAAKANQIKNFTGLDSLYEAPLSPELVLDTEKMSKSECVSAIFERLKF